MPPNIREITNNTRKIKNNILAIDAAPAAIPLKPNMAAIIATTKKVTTHRNIIDSVCSYKIRHVPKKRYIERFILKYKLFSFLIIL